MSFFNQSMGDLTFTQADMAMRSKPLSRVESNYRPWWKVVADNNKKAKVVVIKCNGEVIETRKGKETITAQKVWN